MDTIRTSEAHRRPVLASDEAATKIKNLIQVIAEELVDEPKSVSTSISYDSTEGVHKIFLTAARSDLGKIIGKEGKMAGSLRTIVWRISSKHRIKANLEIG